MKAWSRIIVVMLALELSASGQMVEVWNIFGKQDDSTWKYPAKQLFISGGDPYQGRWLTIIRFDTTAPLQHGFDPSFTYAICKFKPIVKKLKNGMWQISFTMEMAENIP